MRKSYIKRTDSTTKHSQVERTSVEQPNQTAKMKLFAAAAFIATLAFASADVSELGYGYHQPAASAPSNQYIPPAANAPEPAYAPAPVYQPAPSAPVSSYIPPAANAPEPAYAPAPVYQPAPSAPVSSYIPPAANAPEPAYAPAPAPAPVYAPQPAASEVFEQPAQDGYRYRTVRRRVYKQRRF